MTPAFRFSIIVCLLMVLVSCKPNVKGNVTSVKEISTPGQAQIKFETDMHDFGEVIEGEKVSYSFKFTNIGKGPLVITGIASSCGCTVGEYTHDTIKSGKQGDVIVSFDSWNRLGFQQKSVTVNSNTNPSFQMLRIKATVIPANSNNK
ncbi:MAG: DUF1573 domain-containing protein [Bacteroidota bacterium]|nr:DUF1573 domain-containing protein [Bacteroidota bacterium]